MDFSHWDRCRGEQSVVFSVRGSVGDYSANESCFPSLFLIEWVIASFGKEYAQGLIQLVSPENGTMGQQCGDLLALTTHGRSGLQRYLLGSITERMLIRSTLPLLVVHPAAIS